MVGDVLPGIGGCRLVVIRRLHPVHQNVSELHRGVITAESAVTILDDDAAQSDGGGAGVPKNGLISVADAHVMKIVGAGGVGDLEVHARVVAIIVRRVPGTRYGGAN